MNKKHAFAISLLLGLAIVAGAFAATRGGGKTDAQATVTPMAGNALATENARLDRYEATLDRMLAQARHRAARASTARPSVAVVAAPAPAQSWSEDDHFGDDDHGDDDSGHGSSGGRGGGEDD
jgi:hypothetical protein